MGLGNRNAKSGDKGSNHNSEHRQLLLLGKIVTAITGQLAPSPSGIATESTLQTTNANIVSVLNAIVATQDVEVILLRDEGVIPDPIIIKQITSYSTGSPVVTYEKADGTAHTVIGPLVYLDPSAVMNLVLTELLDQGVSLDAIGASLVTLNATDFATETTLLLTNSLLTDIDTVLDTIKIDTAAIQTAVEIIDDSVGTDAAAHGASQKGIRALGTDGTNDQQLLTNASGALQIDILSGGGAVGGATEVTLAAVLAKILAAPSTEAKQDTTITALGTLLTELQLKADLLETQPVSMVSVPLPTGAATEVTLASLLAKVIAAPSTEAKQDAANALLTLIEADTGGILTDTNAMVVDLAAIEVLLTTIDADTSNLDVALSTVATEATQLLANALLTTIDADTSNLDVALSTVATEATLLTLAPAALTLTSLKATLSGNVPAGAKSISFVVVGTGATINGVARPDTWTQTLEYNNDTLPQVDYLIVGGAEIYIDYFN